MPRGNGVRMPLRVRLAIAGVAAAVAACPSSGPGPTLPEPRERPARGGTLRVAIADDIGVLDPQLASQPSSFALVRATQRGLMGFGYGAEPVPRPDLADGPPQVSADGLTYAFRLREGVAFSPPAARALTAADVKAGLERMFRLRAGVRRFFLDVVGASELESGRAGTLAGVTARDARTLEIRLRRPANDLLWMLAHPAASAVPAELGGPAPPQRLSASGPYRAVEVRAGRSTRLVRNTAWKADADPIRPAYVDEIIATVGATSDADVVGEDLAGPAGSHAERFPNGCLLYLFLNTAVPPLGDVRVRGEIARSIDRGAVLAAVRAAGSAFAGDVASGILPPTVAGSGARPPDRSPARIAGFRVEMGWERTGGDAAADGRAAQAVTRQLARIGVTVRPLAVPGGISVYDLYESPARRVPMGIARWCSDWGGRAGRSALGALLDGRRVAARGNTNYALANDGVLNRLLDAATAEQDPARIAPAWESADRRALTLAAVVPIAWLQETAPISSRVRGFRPDPLLARGDPTSLWLSPPGP